MGKRLQDERTEEWRLFDPSGRSRPMKEWVVVPGEHADRWRTLLHAALRAAGGLDITD